MRKTESPATWVIYQVVQGKTVGTFAVCEQGEWDAMERDQPGRHALVRAGIPSEGEAERLARVSGGSGRAEKPDHPPQRPPTSGTSG